MQCVKPYWLKKEQIEVPCGHCIGDRIAYSREWTVRLVHELDDWDRAGFVTLTYDDEHLPADGSLSKEEAQKFMKRLRRRLDGQSVKYFMCGEYGDPSKSFRPHYHIILFGHGRQDAVYDPHSGRYLSEDIAGAWSYGYHEVDTVTYDSCRYVTDYIMKKYNGEKAAEYYGARLVPFRLSSSGLGLSYVRANWRQMLQLKYVTVRGIKMSLPRYYVKKIKEMYEAEKERLSEPCEHMSDDSDVIPLFDEYHKYIVDKAREQQERLYSVALDSNFNKVAKRGLSFDDVKHALVMSALYDEKDVALGKLSMNDSDVFCAWNRNQRLARESRLEARTSLKAKPL